jgi:hypothetical protein
MSIDEIIRTGMYVLLIPGLAYLGVRVWNALVMPELLRKPIAMMLWLQAGIYTLFMAGLLFLRLSQPVPALLWLNTAFIMAQTCLILYIAWKMWKSHIKPLLSVVGMLAMILFWRD